MLKHIFITHGVFHSMFLRQELDCIRDLANDYGYEVVREEGNCVTLHFPELEI